MTIHDVEQRSEAWMALRLGRLTASRAADMTAMIKSGEAAARRNLRVQLLLERITGKSQERGFLSGPMKDGIEREPAALAWYEALTGTLVQPVGFVSHDELMAGCSPDGFVDDDGLVSVKCPIPATHLDFLKSGTVPGEYVKQIVHELWITRRQWCDYVSFQPDFPEDVQAKVVRVYRVDKDVSDYMKLATAFLREVDVEVAAFQTMRTPIGVLREVLA